MTNDALSAGDRVLVGDRLITVPPGFASELRPGDKVLGVAASGSLRRIPAEIDALVDASLDRAVRAFSAMGSVDDAAITTFFGSAADLLAEDDVFSGIARANAEDVEAARARGRSVTRLVLSDRMRADMIAAFRMWRDSSVRTSQMIGEVAHDGWTVEEWRAPLGIVAFVFEGRPNVFADATGVLRSGNVVVFRIGSDALGTARAIMEGVVHPALRIAGLPDGAVVLVDAAEHAAGWRLFADRRVALAVARGSGPAVSELGSIAQQSGVPASLHGTGGAWIIAGEGADADRLSAVVRRSLDRKVCNTLNVLCLPRSRAAELATAVYGAAETAAAERGTRCRIHADQETIPLLPQTGEIDVVRAEGTVREPQVTLVTHDRLGHEFEWEESPEFHLVTVSDVHEAFRLFNEHSPHFVVSLISSDPGETDAAWRACDAPFFGDGFTRWVDGQFALLKPELGLSNWQNGRLFGRGAVLSGDSAHTIRLKVVQADDDLHR